MTLPLIICIISCFIFIIVSTILLCKFVKTEKWKRRFLIILSSLTILCHYSSLLYHIIGNTIAPDLISPSEAFVRSNQNLAIPMYPCNVVMWGCFLLAFIKDKNSKTFKLLVDFLFLFGLVSGLGGMLANGDYFNPNVTKDYDIYKSCIAHAFMIVNILVIPGFGYFKLDTLKNMSRTALGVLLMGVVGLVDSFLILILKGPESVINDNPMFLFRSPLGDSLWFVIFIIIMPLFLLLLFIVLTIVELFKFKRGNRWWNRVKKS